MTALVSVPDDRGAMRQKRARLTPTQLDLVWSMNRFLTKHEFNEFIETSEALGLNPLKRQICAVLLKRPGSQERQVSIITTITGLRAIADRTGTYRPDSAPAQIVTDENLVDGKINPHGIVDCTVTLYRFAHKRWHKIVGQVWWEEIAPIKRGFDGERYIEVNSPWIVRPRGQIIKCAEAAALRAGWPEDLSNVYVEDEMDRARLDAPASLAEDARKERQLGQAVPKGTILADLWDGQGLRAIAVGEFYDRVAELIRCLLRAQRHQDVANWSIQQRVAMRSFFAHDKAAALDLKRQIEQAEATSIQRDAPDGK